MSRPPRREGVVKLRRETLTDVQLDALQEIGNIGAGHAATALSQMVDRKILITVPQVKMVPFAELPDVVGGAETIVSAILIPFFGDIMGNVLFLLPEPGVLQMIDMLKGESRGTTTEVTEADCALLQQTGSILTASYLNALTLLTGLALVPSVADYARDMVGAVMDTVVVDAASRGNTALVVETEFIETSYQVEGQLFFMPPPDSLNLILGKLGV